MRELPRRRTGRGLRGAGVPDGRTDPGAPPAPAGRAHVSTHADVTELKRRERENTLLATALDQAGDFVEVADADYRLTYVNPAFTAPDRAGAARRRSADRPSELLRSHRHDAAFFAAIEPALERGEVWHGQPRQPAQGRPPLYQEATISPLRDARGRLTHFVAVKRDIGERMRAEEALKESEARLAAFMEHAPVGMYLKALDGRYLMLNPEIGRVFGRPAEEMLGRRPEDAFRRRSRRR